MLTPLRVEERREVSSGIRPLLLLPTLLLLAAVGAPVAVLTDADTYLGAW